MWMRFSGPEPSGEIWNVVGILTLLTGERVLSKRPFDSLISAEPPQKEATESGCQSA